MLALETLQAPVLPAQQTAPSSCCEISFLGMKTPKLSGPLTKCGLEEWGQGGGGLMALGRRAGQRPDCGASSLLWKSLEPPI